MKISAKKGKVSFGHRLKQYLFNSEHYSSTKDNPVKWRDILQKRGKIRTLHTDNIFYRATTAKTIKQFNDSLTKTQKFAKKVFLFCNCLRVDIFLPLKIPPDVYVLHQEGSFSIVLFYELVQSISAVLQDLYLFQYKTIFEFSFARFCIFSV